MQSGHPISYFSKKLGPRLRASSTYIKELTAIVEAVHKWRQYLLGIFFVIRTDHKSIKELLQQVVQTLDQQIYIRKLLGYHFRIEYKPGCTNLAADALSRVHEEAGADTSTVTASCLPLLSRPSFELLATLNVENSTLLDMIVLHHQFTAGTLSRDYSLHNGFLFCRNRYYISPLSSLKEVLLLNSTLLHLRGMQASNARWSAWHLLFSGLKCVWMLSGLWPNVLCVNRPNTLLKHQRVHCNLFLSLLQFGTNSLWTSLLAFPFRGVFRCYWQLLIALLNRHTSDPFPLNLLL